MDIQKWLLFHSFNFTVLLINYLTKGGNSKCYLTILSSHFLPQQVGEFRYCFIWGWDSSLLSVQEWVHLFLHHGPQQPCISVLHAPNNVIGASLWPEDLPKEGLPAIMGTFEASHNCETWSMLTGKIPSPNTRPFFSLQDFNSESLTYLACKAPGIPF